VKWIRILHLYLGCLFAPLLIFLWLAVQLSPAKRGFWLSFGG